MRVYDSYGRILVRSASDIDPSLASIKVYNGDLYVKIGSLWYKIVGVDDVGVKSIVLDQAGITL